MKHILFLFFAFCLLFSSQAQNPYIDLSYPWLNLKQVKQSKIKSIMLATMSADNSSVEKQLVLSFSDSGDLLSEECQIGFTYFASFAYDETGHLSAYYFRDETSTDTITYSYFQVENKFIRQISERTSDGNWDISETEIQYNDLFKVISITDFHGIVRKLQAPGANSLGMIAESQIAYNKNEMTLKSQDSFQTLSFDSNGVLQLWKTENILYGISETYEYQYDQNGRLVMISWSQDGQSNKTFVTYEFYK